jgi:hypothetical protein
MLLVRVVGTGFWGWRRTAGVDGGVAARDGVLHHRRAVVMVVVMVVVDGHACGRRRSGYAQAGSVVVGRGGR